MAQQETHLAIPAKLAPRDLRPFYRDVYRHAALPDRLMATWRASICPLEPIVPFVPAGARVLDFGCGVGALLLALAATGRIEQGTGCDSSERAIRTANAARARLHRDVLDFQCVTELARAPSGPFDAVLMIDVLHHVPPPRQKEAVLVVAGRVAPGGVLIYKDMASRPAWRRWANTLHDLVIARQFVNYVPVAEVEHWLTDAGFAVIHRDAYSRLVYGHELRVFRRAA